MTEKTLDQIIDELPGRQLFFGRIIDRRLVFRRTSLEEPFGDEPFFFVEIDRSDGAEMPGIVGRSWWPEGTPTAGQRGPALDAGLVLLEAKLLIALSKSIAFVTMAPEIEWQPDWPELSTQV